MAKSACDKPRGESCHASRVEPARTTCRIGAPAASKGDGASSSLAEKAVTLSTIFGCQASQNISHEVSGGAVLEAADIKAADIEAFAAERARKRLDWREVGGQQIGAVEQDDCERPSLLLRDAKTMLAMQWHRFGAQTIIRREAGGMRHQLQSAARIVRTAGGKKPIEPRACRFIHGGECGEARIGAAIAGQQGESNAACAGGVG